MKSFLTFWIWSFTLFVGNVSAQTYQQVVISDKKKPDNDNSIFVPGRVFTYQVKSSIPNLPNEVIYTVLDLPRSKRTNKNQTEVVISYKPDERRYENTGIVENESNIWLHPPRTGAFSTLESCPFPYLKMPLKKGQNWSDKLEVGEQWSQGKWTGKMSFDIEYEILGDEEIRNRKLDIDFWVIEGIASSQVGTSKLIAHYNPEIGFIQLQYTTLDGETISFLLIDRQDLPVFSSMEQYFSEKLRD